MRSRYNLHQQLVEALGSTKVYFQPPETIKLVYPCIIYNFSGKQQVRANNKKNYLENPKYTITVIDYDPESEIPWEVEKIPYCGFDRSFTSENLHHWVFTAYNTKDT